MAQKCQAIQHLLCAEKEGADLVADARKKKSVRLKQAKEEAKVEIEQFRNECERKFKEKQRVEIGQEDFQKRISQETDVKLEKMSEQVEQNKEKVISRLLDMVYDITPELHKNFRL